MDDIDTILTGIIDRVTKASISEAEKADIYSQLTAGMHRLVWPILLSHVPDYLLHDITTKQKQFTLEDYTELIKSSLQNPATPKEIHDELFAALEEVEALLAKRLPKPPVPAS